MGSITIRKRADGSESFLAQITIKRNGKIVHREAQTFERRPAATRWIKKREGELKAPGQAEAAAEAKREEQDEFNPPLCDVIEDYVDTSRKKIGKTKAQVLGVIQKSTLAKKRCRSVKSSDVVAYLEELYDGGRQASTVGNYLSHLQAVWVLARAAWGYELEPSIIEDARKAAKRLGLIGKSRKRDIRPTLEQVRQLLMHFSIKRAGSNPMGLIMMFAIFSTRRLDEITRIRWSDYEPENSRILVRDMKHPGDKEGNDTWVELPPEAMEIIELMPRTHDQIFPYNTGAVGTAFTRACQFLQFDNLHFHDLRHEGVSRLFEMGRDIARASLVSGHRSWSSLQRYTHIRHSGDRYANFGWREMIVVPKSNVLQIADFRKAG